MQRKGRVAKRSAPPVRDGISALNIQAYLILALTTFIWGGNSVAGKIAVGHVSPMLLTGMRWMIACALLLAIAVPAVRALGQPARAEQHG